MTVLSDTTIKKLRTNLFGSSLSSIDQIQPCSVDLRLDKELKTIHYESINIEEEPYTLQPDEFILGSTIERIHLPNDIVARVEGRSSIGRLGIMVHITAGFIDPGFHGNITLEIKNVSDKPFPLKYGDRLCQVVFETLDHPCTKTYDGKYQGDYGVVCSRWKQKKMIFKSSNNKLYDEDGYYAEKEME